MKLREQISRIGKDNEGRVPKPILEEILRPRLKRLAKELKAKGEEFKFHLFELWKMEDVWTFPNDNSFAALFHTQIQQMCQMVPPSLLCTRCTSICLERSTEVCNDDSGMSWCGLCKTSSQPELNAGDEAGILKKIIRSPYRICAAPG